MADETDFSEQGNEHILEGAQDVMAGIDEVLGVSEGGGETAAPETSQGQQESTQSAEDRNRDERGQFTATGKQEQEAEKAKAEKPAQEQQEQPAKGATEAAGEKKYPAEIKSPKAREHFDALSRVKEEAVRRADAAEAKIKAMEAKLGELEQHSGVQAPEVKVLQRQLADVQAKLEERERILSFKAVEATDSFREKVTQPQTDALAEINDIAATYKLDGRKLDEILAEPSKFKRREMLEDLTAELPERSQFAKGDLRDSVEKWCAAESESKKLYEQAKGNRDYAEQETRQKEAQAALDRQKEYKKGETEVLESLKDKLPELMGDETLWKSIQEKYQKVVDFDRLSPKQKAGMNILSYMVMPALEKYRAEVAAHQQTKDILAKRTSSLPGGGGSGRSAPKPNGHEFEEKEGDDIFGALNAGIDEVMAGGGR